MNEGENTRLILRPLYSSKISKFYATFHKLQDETKDNIFQFSKLRFWKQIISSARSHATSMSPFAQRTPGRLGGRTTCNSVSKVNKQNVKRKNSWILGSKIKARVSRPIVHKLPKGGKMVVRGGHYESYQGETKESESSNIEYEHP